MTLYLAKDPGPHPVCWCTCEAGDALIAAPGQMDCPWCGCGWLFSCTLCRKAFTFAVAVETPLSLREIARGDLKRFGMVVRPALVNGWVGDMAAMLDGLVLGERYAYLDGAVHRTEAGLGIRFKGMYGSHSLARLPQCEPGATGDSLSEVLGREYWQATRAN